MYINEIVAIDNLLKEQIIDSYMASNNDFMYSLDKGFRLIAANQNFLQFVKPITKNQSLQIGDHLLESIHFSNELEKRFKDSILRGLKGESFFDEIHFEIPESVVDKWSEMRFNPIMSNDAVIGVTIISRDITTKKKDAIALGDINNRLNKILMSSSDWIWEVDANGIYTYCSDQITHHLGYSAAEILGKTPFDFMGDDEKQRVGLIFQGIVEQKSAIVDLENWNIHKDGREVCLLTNGYPVLDNNGNLLGYIGVDKDITFRKKNEIELQKINENLTIKTEELTKLNAELERFAFVASHDLQEPLRTVTSFLQLFEKKYRSIVDDNGKKYIDFAVNAAERMKYLIRDLLEYSSSGKGIEDFAAVDLNQIVSDTTQLFEFSNSQLDIEYQIGKLPVVQAMRIKMQQVFQNLIGNAIKYKGEDKLLIEISAKELANEWQISVKDNGIGIDPQYHDTVFELFNRLHSVTDYSGTGIGLAVCKKIIEMHGGKIWVQSNLNQGAEFIFNLPKNRI